MTGKRVGFVVLILAMSVLGCHKQAALPKKSIQPPVPQPNVTPPPPVPTPPPTAGTDVLTGIWKTGCLPPAGDETQTVAARKVTWTFSDDTNLAVHVDYFSDANICKVSTGDPLDASGSYEIGDSVGNGATKLNYSLGDSTTYQIFAIRSGDLYFGETDSRLDASSEENRPVTPWPEPSMSYQGN
jgi:hypothetical protein